MQLCLYFLGGRIDKRLIYNCILLFIVLIFSLSVSPDCHSHGWQNAVLPPILSVNVASSLWAGLLRLQNLPG